MKLSILYESIPTSKRQIIRDIKASAQEVYNDGKFRIIKFEGLKSIPALMQYCKGTALCTKHQDSAERYLGSGAQLFMVFYGSERLLLADKYWFEVSYMDDIPLQDAGLIPEVEEIFQRLLKINNGNVVGPEAKQNIRTFLAGESPY